MGLVIDVFSMNLLIKVCVYKFKKPHFDRHKADYDSKRID